MVQLSGWHAKQLVFVDGSAANLRTPDRKFGWAAVGKGQSRRSHSRKEGITVSFQHIQLMATLPGMSTREG